MPNCLASRPVRARAGTVALLLMLTAGAAIALDLRPVSLEMPIGDKTYTITAEAPANWQSSSEGQLTLDQKFDIRPDGTHGLIQVKIGPAPPGASAGKLDPCTVLQGLAPVLQKEGRRISGGRQPQANLLPVCSMVAESTLNTDFYYATFLRNKDVLIAGLARNSSDLDDTQITEFQRYLASIKATPKETTQ
jgi:hypothetical protein